MQPTLYQKKTIILGITGSIAVGKVIDLIKLLKQIYHVEIIITEHAKQLLDISQLGDLCPIHDQMFDHDMKWKDYVHHVEHISLSDKADLLLIAPATANIIAKIAHGIADDYLTTTVLATTSPIIIAPAMNCKMYENPITQENIEKLKQRGIKFIGPEYGGLACGYEGLGRLLEPERIVEEIHKLFTAKPKKILAGRTVLITSGPTYEEIDPVRIITNKSSGKMGNALCQAGLELGAKVIHIEGPMKTKEMFDKVSCHFPQADIFISCAAVCDFIPANYNPLKLKKTVESVVLELKPNIDILKEISAFKLPHQKIIGFALESNNLIDNARQKLEEKNCDMIVANDISTLCSDTIKALIITKHNIEEMPRIAKEDAAFRIFSKIITNHIYK
ncbi:bifunctional phosphopantothenoylcysteine decarboxylase/phosphopantothenate--cysteine ligase CoaBC [Candidatus Woesearchaeota archaeon]|nr:bifunctional phosphopantothenoylcysteine decarboxylase/phosphopantothenate--cysteine ligase CoaBC [Candidatus Woesearchaeota archaeon]